MTLRTHTVEKKNPKHKQIWEWEETPELLAAIEQLEKSSQAVNDIGTPKKLFIPNQNYAPLKKKNDKKS